MSNPPSPSSGHHARGLALMVLSTVCFATNVLLIRALAEFQEVNVWLVSCARFAVGLLLVLTLYRCEFEATHLFTQSRLIQRGLVGGIGVYGFYLTVVQLGAGRATFINNTYVIFGGLLAVWLLGERFRVALGIGSVAALAGLALLTHAFSLGLRPGPYDLLAVVTALASAWVVVTIRQLHATEHTSTIFAAQCVYGLFICVPPAVYRCESVSAVAGALMLLAGTFAAAGQIAMTRAFRDLPVAEGSLLQMLVPLGIAAGGWFFFGEQLAPHEWIGAMLILAGTAVSAFRR
jgi:drug/metabolite transporter (DMT)-like permease